MKSGTFRNRITIERIRDNPVEDAHGEVDLTDNNSWIQYCRPWAELQTKGGKEFWKVDRIKADVSHLVRVPYDGLTRNITSQMRIRLNGRILNIAAVYDPDEMHEVIEIQAKEPK